MMGKIVDVDGEVINLYTYYPHKEALREFLMCQKGKKLKRLCQFYGAKYTDSKLTTIQNIIAQIWSMSEKGKRASRKE